MHSNVKSHLSQSSLLYMPVSWHWQESHLHWHIVYLSPDILPCSVFHSYCIRIFCKVTYIYSHILAYNNFFTSYIFLPLDPQVAFLLRQASPFGMPSGTFRSKKHQTSSVPPLFVIILHIAAHAVVIHVILGCRVEASHIVRGTMTP